MQGRNGELYDDFYYKHCCGLPYERSDAWLSFFGHIADKIAETIHPMSALDVGCAMGFLVESLRDRGIESYGIDVSEFALGNVRPDIRPFCTLASATDDLDRNYDLIICIEVLEHLPKDEAEQAIANMCRHTADILFSSTPSDYKEPTHINVQPTEAWVELFVKNGFYRDLNFDATFIAPHALRFRKARDPLHRQIATYEQKLFLQANEISQLRSSAIEMRKELAESLSVAEANKDRANALQVTVKDLVAETDRLRADIKRLSAELTTTTTVNARLHADNDALHNEIEELNALNRGLTSGLRTAQAQLEIEGHSREKAEHDMSQLQAQLMTVRRDLEDLESQCSHLRRRVAIIESSRSWRLLRPLRYARALQLAVMRGWRRLPYALRPGPEVKANDAPGRWLSLGVDPWFVLSGPCCGGWIELSYELEGQPYDDVSLYVDSGTGFNESNRIRLRSSTKRHRRHTIYIPLSTVSLRLDPMERPGEFFLDHVFIRPLAKWQLAWRLCGRIRTRARHEPKFVRSALQTLSHGGLRAVRTHLISMLEEDDADPNYSTWIEAFDSLTSADRQAIRAHIEQLSYRPLISVLLPVYNTQEPWLRAAIDSVCKQLYCEWELCIADDASTLPGVRRVLDEYRRRDPRIKVIHRATNGHISAASNSALEIATGEFVVLLDHDDELSETALYHVAVELNRCPTAVLIYSDEDKIDESGRRYDPYFKSDWNPDLFLGQNMISHLGAYKATVLRSIGGFRSKFDGSQDYDLALRVTEVARPCEVRHVAFVLYHWRAAEGSTARSTMAKPYAVDAARRALQDHFDRQGWGVRCLPAKNPDYSRPLFPLPDPLPLVSVIIPTRNRKDLLKGAIDAVHKATYGRVELIIVDNESDDEESLAYLDRCAAEGARVLRYNGPYNYSAINNCAARLARGDLLLLLNNDISLMDDEWLSELVRHASRQEVGAVGAALYYPDGTLQHGGVIVGLGGVAGHMHLRLPSQSDGYFSRATLVQDVSAVTGACLMMRREVFFEVGGLDESALKVAFNDIDLCLRIRQRGYRIVWTPYARLYHHESATRGTDDTPEKQRVFEYECAVMRQRWGNVLENDPYYNPNLSLKKEFRLAWPPRVKKPWL